MAIVVALKPGQRNRAALSLAAALSQAIGESVIAASVLVVAPGVPSPLRVGMRDEDFAAQLAAPTMGEARAILGDALQDERPLIARSVRAGLLDLLLDEAPNHLVLGSAEGGDPGHVNVGDTASALLHTASVPVFLAPPGFRIADPQGPLRRVNVAFGPDDASREALRFALRFADRADAMLRTVTFWVRQSGPSTALGAAPGYTAELSAQWHEQMETLLNTASRELDEELRLPSRHTVRVFGNGVDWPSAMAAVDWEPDDLLVVGSRPRGGLGGVFLGSRAAEILRAAPSPVVVLPG